MTVQAGIWNFDGAPVDRPTLTNMCKSVAEFGADGEETYLGGPLGMLYRPLHTTSESRLERQPLTFNRGQIVTWDGRLDNRDDLILQLNDRLAKDRSDIAIVAASFERWGTESFAKLVGDWALAIWDPSQQRLILARDYMGIKHLFYYATPDRFLWCNHLAPVALSGKQFTLSERYIAGYLAFYPDADLTPYDEIRAVPPGKFVQIQPRKTSIHSYWSFDPNFTVRYKTNGEYEDQFRHLFRQAVRRRLRTDGPILAGLSGGLDSSSIVCVADEILAKEGADAPRLDTLSFCDRDEPDEEDFLYFNKVEERRGRIGHHIDAQSTGDTLAFTSSRFASVPGFGERQEFKLARDEVISKGGYRVFLSGVGGDEFTGQALDFRVQMADLLLQLRLGSLAKQLVEWSLITRLPWSQLLYKTLLLVAPTWVRIRTTKSSRVDPWVREDFAKKYSFSFRLLTAAEGRRSWLPSVRDAYQTYANLARQMTFNLPGFGETRFPFLDRELVEFLMAIPTDQLVEPGRRRSLMRRSLGNILPAEILSRQTKSSTGRCVTITVRKHWNTIESVLSSPVSSRIGCVKPVCLRESLVAAKNGKLPLRLLPLLRTLSFELWLRQAASLGVIAIPPAAEEPQTKHLNTHGRPARYEESALRPKST
jgi:asparagine synthase (glutamine-hydrolysing)